MVNEIITAIAKALSGYSGYEVYTDTMEQGVEEPCFLLKFLSGERIEMLGDRCRIRSHFQIVFLAGTASAINEMSESLPYDIRELKVDYTLNSKSESIRLNGTNIQCHADQGEHTLVCLVDYIYTASVDEDSDLMMTLIANEEVKNG